jgi:YbbR domain-containing protein
LLRDIRNQLNADDLILDNFSHSNLHLTLEPRMDKWVPIRPISDLSYLPGHYLSGNLKFTPDSVKISGPQSMVESIYEWPTAILSLKELKNSYEGSLALKKAPAELSIEPQFVKIKVPVEQVTEKTLFVKIEVKNATQQYRLFPSQIRLICNVGLSQFNSLKSTDFKAEVDLSNAFLQEGNTVPVMVNLQPTIVTNVRFDPKVVEFYEVKKELN